MNIQTAAVWLFLNVFTIVVLSFYSMMEMAAVSFNKLRLQYYVSTGIKQAIWLNYLLHNPSRLFGTTLIMVNIATVSGSEFAREFHQALGINPDFSIFSQVILVIIFGELAPMFAARRYPEHMVMLGIPLIYITAKIMTPFLWLLGIISKGFNYLIGGKESDTKLFLSQEELLKILEFKDDKENHEYDTVAVNILNLHKKEALDIMSPIDDSLLLASNATVLQAKEKLCKTKVNYLIMYHKSPQNIIGILFPRDMIRAPDNKKARDSLQTPWFVTKNTKVSELLQQFRLNNKNVSLVLDKKGLSCAIIDLDDVMEEIFGETRHPATTLKNQFMLERTFPANLTVLEFKELYDIALDVDMNLTLSELIVERLQAHPEVHDSIYIAPFELKVLEIGMQGIRKVSIRTLK
jgi:CBS domain containing-hemolysin-like protein